MSVSVPRALTVGAGEPFTWETFFSQCGGGSCQPNPNPPTIHWTATVPKGISMVRAQWPAGTVGTLDNCRSSCELAFPAGVNRGYDYTLVAKAPGRYRLAVAITRSSATDPRPANNAASTAVTVVRLTLRLRPIGVGLPRSGKVFSWTLELTSGVTEFPLRPAHGACAARVGTTKVAGKATRAAGRLKCTFHVPAGTSGRMLVAKASASVAKASATATRSLRIS